jgi:hypothetical protein
MTQEFLRLAGTTKPVTIINITSGVALAVFPHGSAYSLSKLVEIQIQRFVGVENPNVGAFRQQSCPCDTHASQIVRYTMAGRFADLRAIRSWRSLSIQGRY